MKGCRSFGADPDLVARHAAAALSGLLRGGLGSAFAGVISSQMHWKCAP